MTTFNPSPQQAAIFNWISNGSGSAVIEAVAGAGKTTTLVEGLRRTTGTVGFCAFNKAIADEIADRVAPLGLGTRIKTSTLHSFGNSALRSAFPKTKLDRRKLSILSEQLFEKPWGRQFAATAASMAKQVGIGVICPIDDIREWMHMIDHYSLQDSLPRFVKLEDGIKDAIKLLKASNRNCSKMIDFDDMVYIPVLQKLRVKQYDWVFVDEAQDTNLVRRELVKLMLAPNGRLVAVGDSHQAIYGFTGADCESMENIRKEFNATTLPLTITYRCPKSVVNVAHQWVDHIEAAETAPEGTVDSMPLETLLKESAFNPEDAILCRLTKPLVSLAFTLINQGTPCKVEGRDIGQGLKKLIKKWKVESVKELYREVDRWCTKELANAMEHDSGARCENIEDKAATIKVLADQCDPEDSIEVIYELIDKLFGETNGRKILTLATIHRSKGREWDRVFVLGMDRFSPCKWARKPWEFVQEDNLCYVQVTRAKKHLTFIPV